MTKQAELIKQLKALTKVPVQVIPGEVTEVTAPYYCTVKPVNGPEIYEVRLRASIDNSDTGFIEVPKKNSTVLIGLIGNSSDNCFVVKCSEVEKVLMKVGAKIFELNENGVFLNGDTWSTVKGNILTPAMDANKQFLTAFKQLLSTPINEPGNGAPSAFQAALNLALSGLQLGDHSQIENTNVKHG